MFPISDSEHKARRFPFINISLIIVTIYVFFLQITSPDPDAFISEFALIPARIDFSNLTTLYPFITSIFLHGGFLHIASNMLFLYVFGDNVEGEFPPFTYLFLYLGSGIAGALLQYVFMPHSEIPMLGASGAVAGSLGAYFAFFPHHRIKAVILLPFLITTTQISAAFMLGYWFLLQVISGTTSLGSIGNDVGGVAYFAHIGGFAFGYIIAKRLPNKQHVVS